MSKSEDRIEQIFKRANIKYIREKTFSDLSNGKLRFDFYLPQLNILVEYDSLIHFKQIKKFHKTRQDFVHAQENDRRKNSYSLAKSIKLYRIPEWEFNNIKKFSDILQDKFLVKSKWHNDIVYRQHLGGS